MMRYVPPKGTAGLDRWSVSGLEPFPPPPRQNHAEHPASSCCNAIVAKVPAWNS